MSRITDKIHLSWILSEIPRLAEEKIINEDAADTLRLHYTEQQKQGASASQKYLLTLLTAIGAVLVGGGVIMLFAVNWDMLPKYMRVAVAFIPITIGFLTGALTLAAGYGIKMRETSAVITAAGVFVLVALISQIYHTGGSLHDYLVLVLAVTFPLIIIFRSMTYAGIYSIMLIVLTGNLPYYRWGASACRYTLLIDVALIAALAAYAFYHFSRDQRSACSIAMRYFMFPCAIGAVIICGESGFHSLTFPFYAAMTGLFYIEATYLRDKGEGPAANPWLPVCFINTVVILLAANECRHSINDMYMLILPAAAILASVALMCVRRAVTAERIAILLPALCALTYPLTGVYNRTSGLLVSTVAALFIGIVLMRSGVMRRSLSGINSGMILIMAMAIRWFCTDYFDFIAKGTGFIIIGIVFISVNVIMARRFKRAAAPVIKPPDPLPSAVNEEKKGE